MLARARSICLPQKEINKQPMGSDAQLAPQGERKYSAALQQRQVYEHFWDDL